MQGFLLALQFFTVLPIQKQIDLHVHNATAMYSLLPIIGLFIGILDALYIVAMGHTTFSPVFVAIFFILLHAFYTGGLHIDGWVDMSDAFFSYRDVARRVEILDDPRVGAFGAMSLVALVLAQFAIIYELVLANHYMMLVVVPVLARIGAVYCFAYIPLAKETGIAAFFRTLVNKRVLTITTCVIFGITIIATALYELIFVAMICVFLVITILYKRFCLKNFGGVSGDLVGAYITGSEVLLWLAVLLCL